MTVPEGRSEAVAKLAIGSGIKEVSIYPVYAYGPNCRKEIISAQTSTPLAKKFADAVLNAEWFDAMESSISSRQLRALINESDAYDVTKPMLEPPIDVFEDLWQLNHITVSYAARAAGGAILLAYGMLKNDPVMIVVAALFLPFLSQVVGISFGTWAGDFRLAVQGLKALLVSCVFSICGGVLVAALHGPPMQYRGFLPSLASFAISTVIGFCAGVITEDDAGRRYMIGVAAAVQYGIYPVWLGYCLVAGFPSSPEVLKRLGTFGINIATITVFALIGYLALNIKRRDVGAFIRLGPDHKKSKSEGHSAVQL